ncbi:MAG: hypothetical protein HY854_16110 [Burkholderiales bacterium]|nr:hypothetical protein [Burkholderiales bacterium]
MKRYLAPYDMNRYPAVAMAVRAAATLVVTVTGAVVLATAGPGNGYQPPGQWAAVHRPGVERVSLPAVQVTAKAAGVQSVASSVSCAKGA